MNNLIKAIMLNLCLSGMMIASSHDSVESFFKKAQKELSKIQSVQGRLDDNGNLSVVVTKKPSVLNGFLRMPGTQYKAVLSPSHAGVALSVHKRRSLVSALDQENKIVQIKEKDVDDCFAMMAECFKSLFVLKKD